MSEVYPKLTINKLKRRHWHHSGGFIANFEQITNIVLVYWTDKVQQRNYCQSKYFLKMFWCFPSAPILHLIKTCGKQCYLHFSVVILKQNSSSGSQSFGFNKYFVSQKAVFKINQHIGYTNRTPESIKFQAFKTNIKVLTKVPVYLSQHSFWNLNNAIMQNTSDEIYLISVTSGNVSGVFSGLYFPSFRINTKMYTESEYEKLYSMSRVFLHSFL